MNIADSQHRFLSFRYTGSMTLEFNGDIWYWKGPSPFYFVTVPAQQCLDLKAASKFVTYGWGMIPVKVQIGETEWKTSLFPKDDLYIVPLKAIVRKAENLEEGDNVKLRLELGL
jgi:hypothetical protein